MMTVTADKKKLFLEHLARTDRISASAKNAHISAEAVRVWRKNDPEFAAAFIDAQLEYCDLIETEIHRRAIDGWDEPIYQNGILVGNKKRYDSGLLRDLARSRMSKYRDKLEAKLEVTGKILAVPLLATSEEGFDEIVRKQDTGDAEAAKD